MLLRAPPRDKDKDAKRRRPVRIDPPIQLVIGYVESNSAKDAESTARSYIDERFEAKDVSWYAVTPFRGGYFYECQEGGNGVSYLPEVVDVLSQNSTSGEMHLPSGNRVLRITIQDGRPLAVLLDEEESRKYLGGAVVFPTPSGKMKPAVKSGIIWTHVGIIVMIVGTVSLFSSIAYYEIVGSSQQIDSVISYDALPYRQWDNVKRVPTDSYVNRLRFEDGKWTVDLTQVAKQPVPAAPKAISAPITSAPATVSAPPAQIAAPPQAGPTPNVVKPVAPITATPNQPPVSHGAIIQRPAIVETPKQPPATGGNQ